MTQQGQNISQCESSTETQNLSRVLEFHLMRLSEDPELQPVLFALFLSMYLVGMLGNLLIVLAVSSDSHLHTPMYFFLCNMSLTDICLISVMVPKVLESIHTDSRAIPYVECLTQMLLTVFFACVDDMLLTVMAYDRFVAICHPLHYPVIMNPGLCVLFALMSFCLGGLDFLLHLWIPLQFPHFKEGDISNFFCEPSQILNLSCSDTLTRNTIMCLTFIFFGLVPVSGIFLSYYRIVSSILKVPTAGGKCKAFSTCGSHLSVVCLFYGTGFGVYLSSAVSKSSRHDVIASVMYTVVTPVLNPFIYSLRNKDIKNTLRRLRGRAA